MTGEMRPCDCGLWHCTDEDRRASNARWELAEKVIAEALHAAHAWGPLAEALADLDATKRLYQALANLDAAKGKTT